MGLALGGTTAGCIDPPLGRVNVTVPNLGSAVTIPRELSDQRQITFTLCFIPEPGADAGPSPPRDSGVDAAVDDAGRRVGECLEGEIRRGIFYPQADPFTFTVQVEPRRYRAVRVSAVGGILCGSSITLIQIAAGTSGMFDVPREGAADVTVSMGREEIGRCP